MELSVNTLKWEQAKADLAVLILEPGKEFVRTIPDEWRALAENYLKGVKDKKIKKELLIHVGKGVHYLCLTSPSFITTDPPQEKYKILASRIYKEAEALQLAEVLFWLDGKDGPSLAPLLSEGLLLGSYSFDRHKKETDEFLPQFKASFAVAKNRAASTAKRVELMKELCGIINECRDLVNEPNEYANPPIVIELAKKLAGKQGLEFEHLDPKRLKKEGYNCLLAVGGASKYPPQMGVIKYRPASPRSKTHLCLLGKGITFDAGGMCLKPPQILSRMTDDKAGAAAVIYYMKTLSLHKPAYPITAIFPLAHNTIGPAAYMPGDILKTRSGKSIHIENTDAEGRLILVDALERAALEKPTHIIDLATLTGACMIALGVYITGIMGNNQQWVDRIIASGREVGELYWQLPLHPEYKELLQIPVADINNVGKGSYGGAITAGLFLEEFIPEGARWAHLDIAGPAAQEKQWRYYAPGGTAFGLKTLFQLTQSRSL